jgi:insertion element IS1 protein InsB
MVLPKQRHIIGKQHTVAIERDNSNTRHYSARMTRRTKVVSKKVEMVDISLRIQEYLRTPENFVLWQSKLSCIYA